MDGVKVFVVITLLANVCVIKVTAAGYYTIVAPKVIHPALDYHVSVSVHDVQQSVNMYITIGGQSDSGEFVSSNKNLVLDNDKTSVVNFQIGMWGSGNYTMKVVGSGGLNFVNETELSYEHKSYMVFIQTDKAIYKPSQPVLFRVVVVSPSLRPTGTERLDIFITDGQGNRVKQWNKVSTTMGVFSGEMPLSEEPVLGDWNITVKILDQVYLKSFTVAEYVLPSFDVTIDIPSFVTFNDSKINAIVKAKYTYGKPVKGKAIIMVTPLLRSQQIRTYFRNPLRKTVEIDGSIDVPFNLQQELNWSDDFHRAVRFEAIVTEAVTERRENTTKVMGMFKYKEKIELIKTSETFKPGLKFSAFIKVAYHDDIPVTDAKAPLIIRYGYTHDTNLYEEITYNIPSNGTVPIVLYPPLADNIRQLIIIAKYKDVLQHFPAIQRAESLSNTFVQAILLTENPKVGNELLIHVNSTAVLTSFNVVVMGRGDIVFAETVSANGQKNIAVKFVVTANMAPRTRFLIYYTTESGEVIADGLSFEVDGVFQNSVSLESNKPAVQPGDQVNFQVTTRPSSFIGLLAVDQSVLLLKSGNDITQNEILDQLEMFDPGKQAKNEFDSIYSSIWFPGSATASDVFKDAGVMTLTNALVYDQLPFLTPRDRELRPGGKEGTPAGDYFIPKESDFVYRDPHDGSVIPITRQHFPETWIWNNVTAGGDGKAVFTTKAPDTITSWVISAFSIDPLSGLAVTNTPLRMTVFRPFFISLNLPYSVIRNEAIAIQVVVFNYMREAVTATVTLENTNKFDFVTVEDNENEVESLSKKSKKALIESGEPVSIYFMIVPKELGYIDIKVTATSDRAGDALQKQLLVKPEGVPLHFNKAFLVDLKTASSFDGSAEIDIPKNVVEGSERVEISAIADIMGPTIDNFNNLIQLPFGCGEQNMIRLVPNIVVLQYLSTTGRLTPTIEANARRNMETGYQRELTYKREDGSFSAFGDRDKTGSTWLTAFVTKFFAQAKRFITIDDKVINASLTWLVQQQTDSGSFPEVGSISNKEIQGGSGNGLALTAYVLLAFVENQAHSTFTGPMTKALRLLESEVESMEDPYTIAIVSYVLHLSNSNFKENAFRKLQQLSIKMDGMRFWSKDPVLEPKGTKKETKSIDIEITAYALMTYVNRNDLPVSVEIMKWLVSKRNSNGGFISTQDTVVAIEALNKLAYQIVDPQVNIDISFTYDGDRKTFQLYRENAMILMKETIPTNIKTVNISATGTGFAVVQVSYSYNVMVSKALPAFQVNPFVDRSSTKDRLQLNVCTAYGEKDAVSNMAVMEVTLPSGYVVDRDSLPALNRVDEVKRVDITNGDTGLVIYFDKLDNKLVCPTIKAFRTFRVAKQKPTAVHVYDYYDQGKGARHFFQTQAATLCDLCDGEECNSSKCRREAEEEKAKDQDQGCSNVSHTLWLLISAAVLSILFH